MNLKEILSSECHSHSIQVANAKVVRNKGWCLLAILLLSKLTQILAITDSLAPVHQRQKVPQNLERISAKPNS